MPKPIRLVFSLRGILTSSGLTPRLPCTAQSLHNPIVSHAVAGRLGTRTGRSIRLLGPRGVGRFSLERRAGDIGLLVLAMALGVAPWGSLLCSGG